MRVLLDDEQVRDEPSDAMVLGQVLELVQGQLQGSGHAIRSVVVDGIELPLWAEEMGRSVERVSEVRVLTTPVSQLLSETVRSALTYLRSLEAGIAEAGRHFVEGNDHQGSDTLGHAVEGLDWYITFLADVGRLDHRRGQGAKERMRAVRDKLQSVVAAWEGRDYGLLADLLQYELAPELAEGRIWLEQWPESLVRSEG